MLVQQIRFFFCRLPLTYRIIYTKTHQSGLCDVTKDPDTTSGLFCWSARYNRSFVADLVLSSLKQESGTTKRPFQECRTLVLMKWNVYTVWRKRSFLESMVTSLARARPTMSAVNGRRMCLLLLRMISCKSPFTTSRKCSLVFVFDRGWCAK